MTSARSPISGGVAIGQARLQRIVVFDVSSDCRNWNPENCSIGLQEADIHSRFTTHADAETVGAIPFGSGRRLLRPAAHSETHADKPHIDVHTLKRFVINHQAKQNGQHQSPH